MLASLTRALRDLQALRKQIAATPGSAVVEDDDDDMLPADIDAIRRELEYKLEAMAAGAPSAIAPDPQTWRAPDKT
jgi:hypothetical protein